MVLARGTVLPQMREILKQIADRVGGHSRVSLWHGSGEVTGEVRRDVHVESDGDISQGAIGSAFRLMENWSYYRDTFFQCTATLVVGQASQDLLDKSGSPTGQSKVGPGGNFYQHTPPTYWYLGDAQKAIVALGAMIRNFQAFYADAKLVTVSVWAHWSPVRMRPPRGGERLGG
jgi:hypothetical protein